MADEQLVRLLRSVGLRVFAEYFDVFSNPQTIEQRGGGAVAGQLRKLKARRTRVSCARRIIAQGQTEEALEIISQAARVDASTASRAIERLQELRRAE